MASSIQYKMLKDGANVYSATPDANGDHHLVGTLKTGDVVTVIATQAVNMDNSYGMAAKLSTGEFVTAGIFTDPSWAKAETSLKTILLITGIVVAVSVTAYIYRANLINLFKRKA